MTSESQIYTIRLRDRGQVTIPRIIRDKLQAEEGDLLTLIQIDDLMLLTPQRPGVPTLTEKFTAVMEEEGVSLADLLAGLEEERRASKEADLDGDA